MANTDVDGLSLGSAVAANNPDRVASWRLDYSAAKRAIDVCAAVLALPFVLIIALALVPLNAVFNRGPLFYTQKRMGRGCSEFTIIKFRSMSPTRGDDRGPNDPLELNRITTFGSFLRRSRIDELPQLLNVLAGDMSLIGPRPDVVHHANAFVEQVPGYRHRYSIRPGITGLAQVCSGYAEGRGATEQKVRYDNIYIRRMGWRLDTQIAWRTVGVILTGFGAR